MHALLHSVAIPVQVTDPKSQNPLGDAHVGVAKLPDAL